MKTLVEKDGKLVYEDASIGSWLGGSILNPITFSPSTASQTLVFGGIMLIAGMCVGQALGEKIPGVSMIPRVGTESDDEEDYE